MLGDALVNSLKLGILAFIIVVPLSILGGVYAALNEGSKRDRVISLGGLSATAIPDFVWAVLLILVFSLVLGIFPATATAPPGSGFLDQLYYLILPAFCLVFVLFGYIARMARAGTIEALDADYTRTAIIKGLPQRTVVRGHVLRNSLLPTIAVVATQAGYLLGGLLVIETIFNYQGIGQALYRAAVQKDFPLLQTRRAGRRRRLPRRHAAGRHRVLGPQPARAARRRAVSAVAGANTPTAAAPVADEERKAQRERSGAPVEVQDVPRRRGDPRRVRDPARSSASCSRRTTRSRPIRSTTSRRRPPSTCSAPTASAATCSRA